MDASPIPQVSIPALHYRHQGTHGLLTFGGRGTKLIYYPSGSNAAAGKSPGRGGSRARLGAGQDQQGLLYLIPLELSDDQKAELAKFFPARKS